MCQKSRYIVTNSWNNLCETYPSKRLGFWVENVAESFPKFSDLGHKLLRLALPKPFWGSVRDHFQDSEKLKKLLN